MSRILTTTLSVIDTASNTVVGTPIPVGNAPYAGAVAVTPDGKHVYVVNTNTNTVSVIDTASNMVVGTPIPVGNAPAAVAVAPDGKHGYVTNTLSNNVSVIDTATNTVEPTVIMVGSWPDAVAVTPDGKHVYVANANSANVSVIDTTTNTVGPTISVAGLSRTAVAVTPDGTHVYVASYPNGGGGNIYVIDTATNTVEPTVITVGNAPNAVAVTPDGKHVYVANTNSANVSVIDTTTNPPSVMATVGVGAGAAGVAVTPDGKHVYVTNAYVSTVSVIDTASNLVVGNPIPVGNNPIAVAIVPPSSCIPFLAFNAKLEIDLEHKPNKDHFELLSSFTLGSASNGTNPVTEAITLQIGTFTTTIPAGSFKEIGGIFVFHGVIGGARLEALIAPTGSSRYALVAAAQDANLTGTVNPVPVTLTIGDDCGTASVTALIF
jgi:YVTN family beta-propeller protein